MGDADEKEKALVVPVLGVGGLPLFTSCRVGSRILHARRTRAIPVSISMDCFDTILGDRLDIGDKRKEVEWSIIR
jgi:hypothetical protein